MGVLQRHRVAAVDGEQEDGVVVRTEHIETVVGGTGAQEGVLRTDRLLVGARREDRGRVEQATSNEFQRAGGLEVEDLDRQTAPRFSQKRQRYGLQTPRVRYTGPCLVERQHERIVSVGHDDIPWHVGRTQPAEFHVALTGHDHAQFREIGPDGMHGSDIGKFKVERHEFSW